MHFIENNMKSAKKYQQHTVSVTTIFIFVCEKNDAHYTVHSCPQSINTSKIIFRRSIDSFIINLIKMYHYFVKPLSNSSTQYRAKIRDICITDRMHIDAVCSRDLHHQSLVINQNLAECGCMDCEVKANHQRLAAVHKLLKRQNRANFLTFHRGSRGRTTTSKNYPRCILFLPRSSCLLLNTYCIYSPYCCRYIFSNESKRKKNKMKCNVVIAHAHAHSTGTGCECGNVYYAFNFPKTIIQLYAAFLSQTTTTTNEKKKVFSNGKIKSKHLIYVLYVPYTIYIVDVSVLKAECSSSSSVRGPRYHSTINACNYVHTAV